MMGGTNPSAQKGRSGVCVCAREFVVMCVFGKEEKKTEQSMAPGLHRGSGDIKDWMASKLFLSSEPSNKRA